MAKRLQFWCIIWIIVASNLRVVFAQDFIDEILGQPSEDLSVYFPLPGLQPITIENASHFKPLAFIYPTSHWVTDITFSPNEKWFAVSMWNNVELWDMTDGKSLTNIHSEDTVWGLSISPDGTLLAVATNDGIALLKVSNVLGTALSELNTYLTLDKGQGLSSSISTVVFNSNGNILISVGADGVIRFWDARAESKQYGHQIDEVAMPAYQYMNTSLVMGGNILVYRDDHMLKAWKVDVAASESSALQVNLTELYTLMDFSSYIGSTAFSSNNLLLAAVSHTLRDSQLHFLNATTGKVLPFPLEKDQPGDYGALAFNGDDSLLFAATDSQTYGFEVLDRTTGKSVQNGLPNVSSIAVNSAGTLLVTGHASDGWGGALVLWGVPTH